MVVVLLGFCLISMGQSYNVQFARRAVAGGPASLEFYKASKTDNQNETGTTYVDYLTLTVDRSGESVSKDFFVFNHLGTTAGGSETVKARLEHDGATIFETPDINHGPDTDIHKGISFQALKQVNLTAASHTFSNEFAVGSGTGTITAENASIVVMEKSAGAEYAERTSELCINDNTFTAGVSLTFTPAIEGNYVFIWAAEMKAEDETHAQAAMRFVNDTDTVIFGLSGRIRMTTTSNDNKYFTAGGVAFENVEASAHTYNIEVKGSGVEDEMCIKNSAIVAMPFADFANVYTDSQTSKTIHQGTTFVDTAVLLATQSVNAADHLILAGVEVSNESDVQAGVFQLTSAGTDFNRQNWEEIDEDQSQFRLQMAVHGVTLSSGTEKFAIQVASSNGASDREAAIQKAYMVVLEIP